MDWDEEENGGSIHDLGHAPNLPEERTARTLSGSHINHSSHASLNAALANSHASPGRALERYSHTGAGSSRSRLWSIGSGSSGPKFASSADMRPSDGNHRLANINNASSNTGDNKRRATLFAANKASLRLSNTRTLSERSIIFSNQESSSSAGVYDLGSHIPPPPLEKDEECAKSNEYSDKEEDASHSPDSDFFTDTWNNQHGTENDMEDDSEHLGSTSPGQSNEQEPGLPWYNNSKLLQRLPKLDQIAIAIVHYAPCFIMFGFRTPTHRAILGRLNILLAIVSLFPIGACIFLVDVLYNRKIANGNIPPQELPNGDDEFGAFVVTKTASATWWNVNGILMMLGLMSLFILIATIFTQRAVRAVNLVGAMRYLWVIGFVLPFLVFASIGLIDYFQVTAVWIKHWWRQPDLAWFRLQFCPTIDNLETYNTLCTVPNIDNENEWCLLNYNSTSCTGLRDYAQAKTQRLLLSVYIFGAIWGFFLVILCFLSVDTLERMISKPLVAKARTSSIPLLLFLPMVCCIAQGSIFAFARQSILTTDKNIKYGWIGPAFIAVGGFYFCAALLGSYISNFSILSTNDKRRKLAAVWAFIILMLLSSALLLILFCVSISFSGKLVSIPLSYSTRGKIACALDAGEGCSRCDQDTNICPEWSTKDVTTVLQSQAKTSATVAAIFFVYSFGATRVGFTMRKHISMYQIEYV